MMAWHRAATVHPAHIGMESRASSAKVPKPFHPHSPKEWLFPTATASGVTL